MGLLPAAGVIQSIWDALVNAEKPLLVCGQDIGVAGAGEDILTLAERLALPVATGFFDSASFPAHHPNYIGQVESVSEEEYDVVCCVGYRQNTRGYPVDLRFAKTGTMIGSATTIDAGQHVPARPRCGAMCGIPCARSTACGRRRMATSRTCRGAAEPPPRRASPA
jgi:thiamine pyrophosphate-dependent acetolactate synthase large subunit-like protein